MVKVDIAAPVPAAGSPVLACSSTRLDGGESNQTSPNRLRTLAGLSGMRVGTGELDAEAVFEALAPGEMAAVADAVREAVAEAGEGEAALDGVTAAGEVAAGNLVPDDEATGDVAAGVRVDEDVAADDVKAAGDGAAGDIAADEVAGARDAAARVELGLGIIVGRATGDAFVALMSPTPKPPEPPLTLLTALKLWLFLHDASAALRAIIVTMAMPPRAIQIQRYVGPRGYPLPAVRPRDSSHDTSGDLLSGFATWTGSLTTVALLCAAPTGRGEKIDEVRGIRRASI